jgi:hypothetical protein
MNAGIIAHRFPPAHSAGPVSVRCEVTPGQFADVEVPGEMLERYVACKLVPVAGRPGAYRVAVKAHRPLVAVTDDLGERMGFGLERRQILALAAAGLIDAYRCTTGTTLVDPESVWEHIYSTRMSTGADGQSLAQQFWSPEKVRAYSDAAEFVRAAGIVTQSRREKAAEIPHLEFDFGEPVERLAAQHQHAA